MDEGKAFQMYAGSAFSKGKEAIMKRRKNGKVWVVGLVLFGLFAFGSLLMSAGKESFFASFLSLSAQYAAKPCL